MALDKRIQRLAESELVEGTTNPRTRGDVVRGCLGLEPRQKPQTLLRVRQRKSAIGRGSSRQGRRKRGGASRKGRFDAASKLSDRWVVEDSSERQFDTEGGSDARDELCRDQRMAAELEE